MFEMDRIEEGIFRQDVTGPMNGLRYSDKYAAISFIPMLHGHVLEPGCWPSRSPPAAYSPAQAHH